MRNKFWNYLNFLYVSLIFYRPEWSEPIVAHLPNDEILYSMPLPGSGTILAFIMNILNGFIDVCQHTCIKNYQRIVESFKYGYGKRTELGDKNFVSGIEDVSENNVYFFLS